MNLVKKINATTLSRPRLVELACIASIVIRPSLAVPRQDRPWLRHELTNTSRRIEMDTRALRRKRQHGRSTQRRRLRLCLLRVADHESTRYRQSQLFAEPLLDAAARESNVPVCIHRVGHITRSVTTGAGRLGYLGPWMKPPRMNARAGCNELQKEW